MKGGKREGSGRKPSPNNYKREMLAIRLPKWLINWLKEKKDQGRTIEKALKEYFKLEEPKE